MKIHSNASELIGGTPLVELKNIEKHYDLKAKLIAKLEYFNPAGSVKDRIALSMINAAEAKGLLGEGSTIIEPTSGNTGIGLAAIAAIRGYNIILTMPESMSEERRKLLSAYGAELVLTDAKAGMSGAIEKAKELAAHTPNSFIPSQFENPANPEAHYKTTAPEIWDDTDGEISCFVAGVGTGGTISGVGKYLKEKNGAIKIIAVEPKNSPVLAGGAASPHQLQGIGAGFVPDTLDTSIYDEIYEADDKAALAAGRLIAQKEGILVGISSGAALCAAVEYAKKPENEGKTVVVLFPDTGDRYLSTAMSS